MTSTTLLDLAQRVEAGSGADTQIDHEIRSSRELDFPPKPWNYTSSIDATEALRARLLPGSVLGSILQNEGWQATVWLHAGVVTPYFGGDAPTEPRARLAAILRAYAGRAE